MAIIADVGINRSAQVVMDDVSHAAIGTGTGAESTADIKLTTESFRQAPTSQKRQANQMIIRTFIANADLPATTEEIGWFMNGTGTTDSGELLVRHLLTFVKGTSDLNITLQMTLNRN